MVYVVVAKILLLSGLLGEEMFTYSKKYLWMLTFSRSTVTKMNSLCLKSFI